MTRGLVRWQEEGDLHFVATDSLQRVRVKYGLQVVGYVFMPEHLHLFVSELERGLLADAIKIFKLSVSLRQNRRPFRQKRYYDRNLSSHNAIVDTLRYVHRNPVERGLVTEPEQWAWSSYGAYASGAVGLAAVDLDWARRDTALLWTSRQMCQSPRRRVS